MVIMHEGGAAVVSALERRGVRELFSVSGGPINSIYNATRDTRVRLVHTRHEAAAGFMADAIYRATGRPGAALSTLGPGVTNLVTPAACAAVAGVPLLLIGGQVSTRVQHRGAGMELNTVPLMDSVCKWAVQVPHAARIEEFVDEAYRRMQAGTPGPVYLELPVDVLKTEVEDAPISPAPTPATATGADPALIEALRHELKQAQRVLLIAGDEVFHQECAADLRELVDRAGVAVTTLRLARGAVDELTCPHWIGPGYVPANPVLVQALGEADAVILLGHHWEFDLDFGSSLNAGAKVVQVHTDQSRLGRNGRVDLPVLSATRGFLTSLAQAGLTIDAAWGRSLAARWTQLIEGWASVAGPGEGAHPASAITAVMAEVADDVAVVTSHGNIDFWADALVRVRHPRTYLRVGQAGALGAEIPFGIGAALARDRAAVVFVGDGGVGYHISELETAVRHEVPVVVVVLDDQRWGAIALPQRLEYGAEVAMELPQRDWAAVARGLGAAGVIAEVAELRDHVRAALDRTGPTLIQVPVRSELSPYMQSISG